MSKIHLFNRLKWFEKTKRSNFSVQIKQVLKIFKHRLDFYINHGTPYCYSPVSCWCSSLTLTCSKYGLEELTGSGSSTDVCLGGIWSGRRLERPCGDLSLSVCPVTRRSRFTLERSSPVVAMASGGWRKPIPWILWAAASLWTLKELMGGATGDDLASVDPSWGRKSSFSEAVCDNMWRYVGYHNFTSFQLTLKNKCLQIFYICLMNQTGFSLSLGGGGM